VDGGSDLCGSPVHERAIHTPIFVPNQGIFGFDVFSGVPGRAGRQNGLERVA